MPQSLREDWNGDATLRFRAYANGHEQGGAAADENEVLSAEHSSKLFRWTMKHLQAAGLAVDAAPSKQPASVHELTPRLFAEFDFPDGHIHLAGCTLEDRPIVRLTTLVGNNGNQDALQHSYFWPSGEPVEEDLIDALHLQEVVPDAAPAGGPAPDTVRHWIATAKKNIDRPGAELIAVTIVWCKYAAGKIALRVEHHAGDEESGEDTAIAFEGWATLLADGTIKPPPFHCPYSGLDTYHLAATDDGRIAAAEAVGKCGETGRRMLRSELGKCAVTGQTVCSALLETCRASGERAFAQKMVECAQCDQRVSPGALKGGRCSACRSLAPIRKDDPRMARLLDFYPHLDRWSRWKLAETQAGYVLVATSWLRQLLLVVDKQSLEVAHAATAGRFFSSWQELPSGEREELLG